MILPLLLRPCPSVNTINATSGHAEAQESCTAQIHPVAGSARPSKCCCRKVEDKITHILSSTFRKQNSGPWQSTTPVPGWCSASPFLFGDRMLGASPGTEGSPVPQGSLSRAPWYSTSPSLARTTRGPLRGQEGSGQQSSSLVAAHAVPLCSPSLPLTPAPAPKQAVSFSRLQELPRMC